MAGRKPSDKKRCAIMAAAIAEFHEHGFEGTSMDRIAERGEVSKRTVYNHFESKRKLFLAFLDSAFKEKETCCAVFVAGIPIRAQLRAFIEADIKIHADPERLASARTMVADVLRNPDLAAMLFEQVGRVQQDQRDWFDAAHEAGELNLDSPGLAAKLLMSMVHGFFFWPQIFLREEIPKDEDRARIVESILDTFLARYGVQPST